MGSVRTTMNLGHGYQERMSARAHDPGYAESDSKGAKAFTEAEATGATAEVTFKKRPFGILRYAPGADAKNAMVMEIIPKSRYPGDPQGQAFAAGVKSGWIVKSINGEEVQVSHSQKSWMFLTIKSWIIACLSTFMHHRK